MSAGEVNARRDALWEAVDSLLARASLSGILAHKLGPLAASRLRRLGEPVPSSLVFEERAASLSALMAVPLVERVRSNCEGLLVLIKGPEVARLYPGAARRFGDIDFLTGNAESVQRDLLARGFVEFRDPDFDALPEHHHLTPLKWPTIGLNVEVHASPNWPVDLRPPPLQPILNAAVPSALGVAGVSTLTPHHHALILAAHAWRHQPLWTLRDLIDIAVVSALADERDLDRTAAAWGIHRLWRTTHRAIDATFYGGRETFALRTWARHLEPARDRTNFERHVASLVHGYWGMSPHLALAQTMRGVRYIVEPVPSEASRRRMMRARRAFRNVRARVGRRSPR